MEKKPISHLLAGAIIGLIGTVFFLVFYYQGTTFEKSAINYIPLFVTVGLLIFFVHKYSVDLQHNVTFGQCFTYGFKITAVMAIISFIVAIIIVQTQPAFKEMYLDMMRSELSRNEKLSEAQVEQGVETMAKFFGITVLGGGLFMNLLTGAIASLIGAAVARKNPNPNPFNA